MLPNGNGKNKTTIRETKIKKKKNDIHTCMCMCNKTVSGVYFVISIDFFKQLNFAWDSAFQLLLLKREGR